MLLCHMTCDNKTHQPVHKWFLQCTRYTIVNIIKLQFYTTCAPYMPSRADIHLCSFNSNMHDDSILNTVCSLRSTLFPACGCVQYTSRKSVYRFSGVGDSAVQIEFSTILYRVNQSQSEESGNSISIITRMVVHGII